MRKKPSKLVDFESTKTEIHTKPKRPKLQPSHDNSKKHKQPHEKHKPQNKNVVRHKKESPVRVAQIKEKIESSSGAETQTTGSESEQDTSSQKEAMNSADDSSEEESGMECGAEPPNHRVSAEAKNFHVNEQYKKKLVIDEKVKDKSKIQRKDKGVRT